MKRKLEFSWGNLGAVIVVLALFCLASYGVYALFASPSTATESQAAPDPNHIPTFTELQQALVGRGYDIEVDGIIGKETLRAWESEVCNDYYRKIIKRMAKGKE